MEELKDLKNGLKVLNDLGDSSYTDETATILKEEIGFLQEDNKNKSSNTKTTREPKSTPSKQE